MCLVRLILLFTLSCILISGETTNGGSLKILRKFYDQCAIKDDIFKCFKIQALKIVERALQSKSFNIIDGISIIRDEKMERSYNSQIDLNETKLEKLDNKQIDGLLIDTTSRFIGSHKLEVSVPKLVEESRRKKGKNHGHGALLWALAIKGSFLAMAYNGIAVMAGTALIVGKMALLLSAILGLKKLVNSGHEKTTFEIVKHPKYSESHTHSSSYEDDGHYRRNVNSAEEFGLRSKAYRAYSTRI